MKLSLAQLNYTVGDFEGNKIKIIDAVCRAKADGADLVVFAEGAISGTPAYGLLHKADFLEQCEEVLIEIAAFCDGIAVLVGMPVMIEGRVVSAAAFVRNRKIEHFITRRYVTQTEDMGFISGGRGCECIVFGEHRIVVVVGEDALRADDYSGYADTVINLSASKYARQKIEKRYDRFASIAFSLGVNFVAVNNVGASTDVIYDGSSCMFDSYGRPIALLNRFEEDYRIVDLDADNAVLEVPYQNKTENVYNAIRLGLRDFFVKNGYRKACLGLSGGIDSAVVAALAADVLGAENVCALLMPSLFSSDHSVEDARQMVDRLGIEHHTVPITGLYRDAVEALEPVFGRANAFGVAEENIQARLRGMLLMAYSNKYGHILLNTTNKSELALGWCTLYGDNTGMLSVIGDVYKGEVFDLARHINRAGEIIPENILLKQPSAELRPDQKDTDYLPPYDETDSIIYRMIEEGQSREEIINAGYDAEIVRHIYRLILRNEQKRYQFCPVLRVSTCPLATRVMPITSKYGF